jgi:hypothetical protein
MGREVTGPCISVCTADDGHIADDGLLNQQLV